MGVRHGHRAAGRHGRGQPDGRGRGRDHGADPQGPPRRRGVPLRGLLRGGDGGGAGRVRDGAASQRGGPVVSRRTLVAVILGAWIVSLGWLVKREVFQPTGARLAEEDFAFRSEEHTSELQSRLHLVCRLLLEKKKRIQYAT